MPNVEEDEMKTKTICYRFGGNKNQQQYVKAGQVVAI
jgi:hypothetical protein